MMSLLKVRSLRFYSSGFRAEVLFCEDVRVKRALSHHFQRPIPLITKVTGLKYDLVIGEVRIQNKNFNSVIRNDRGHSFDRRRELLNPSLQAMFINCCIKREKVLLTSSSKEDMTELVKLHLMGSGKEYPTHFTVTTTTSNRITELYIIKMDRLLELLCGSLYEQATNASPVRKKPGTCIHLSPYLYLQRKGGGRSDKRADDVQSKVKLSGGLMGEFERLVLE